MTGQLGRPLLEDILLNIPDDPDESENECDKFTASITPQQDDPYTLAFTFRSVLIGSIWAIFLASCNLLFSFRTNWFTVPVTFI